MSDVTVLQILNDFKSNIFIYILNQSPSGVSALYL